MKRLIKFVFVLWCLANAVFIIGTVAAFFGKPLVWFEEKYTLFGYVYIALSAILAAEIVVQKLTDHWRERNQSN